MRIKIMGLILLIIKAGGHGFGLGVNGGDVARWPALFVNWMKELNMIDQR